MIALNPHIAGRFTPSAIANCPFAIARARIAKTVTEKRASGIQPLDLGTPSSGGQSDMSERVWGPRPVEQKLTLNASPASDTKSAK
jgi:hypothetical protein